MTWHGLIEHGVNEENRAGMNTSCGNCMFTNFKMQAGYHLCLYMRKNTHILFLFLHRTVMKTHSAYWKIFLHQSMTVNIYSFKRVYIPMGAMSVLFIKLNCCQWECQALTLHACLCPLLPLSHHLFIVHFMSISWSTCIWFCLQPSQQGSFLWDDPNKE